MASTGMDYLFLKAKWFRDSGGVGGEQGGAGERKYILKL